jgi:hypothetical protein
MQYTADSDFMGYKAVKAYIRARDIFIDTLQALGYEGSRQTRDASLMDSIKEFIDDGLSAEVREYLLPDFERLCQLRWDAYVQLEPLAKRYLQGRQYRRSQDPTGEIEIRIQMALEKALDRAKLPNIRYIHSWFRPTWENAIRSTHCLVDVIDEEESPGPQPQNIQHAAYQRREISVVFGDAYVDETDRTLNPIDEQTPESHVLENELDPNAVLEQVIRDARSIRETAVVEYILQLKQEIERKGRMPRLRQNSLELAKLRALLMANGLSPKLLCS